MQARAQDHRGDAGGRKFASGVPRQQCQRLYGLVQATRERHLPCPGADAIRQKCWRATDGNVSQQRKTCGSPRSCFGLNASVRIGPVPNGTRKSASGANGDEDGNVSSKLRRAWQQKEGNGKPKGVRLTVRTHSAGANPMDGAKVEKTWRVAKVGAQRCKTAWSTRRHRAQAEQAAFNRKHANPGC